MKSWTKILLGGVVLAAGACVTSALGQEVLSLDRTDGNALAVSAVEVASDGSTCTLRFAGVAGEKYTVWCIGDLLDGEWQPCGTWTMESDGDAAVEVDVPEPGAFFAVGREGTQGSGVSPANAVGVKQFTISAGGVAALSLPFHNLESEDGLFRFGETGIAQGLPTGSSVFFWDADRCRWDGGMKSDFGWDPAEANRVLLPGEGFCVRNGGAEAVEVAAVGEIPSDESLVRAYRGGGEWTFVAYPYPCGEDIQFGATELAMQLGKGASMMFWDASVQGWYTYSKSAKGWSSAGASRVLGEGEAFFVQSAPDDADGTWTVWKP